MDNLRETESFHNTKPAVSLNERVMAYLEKARAGEVNYFTLGWGDEVDYRCRGLEPGNLVVVGGENKAGKTTFAANTAASNIDRSVRTLVITTEVSDEQYALRFASRATGISIRTLREGAVQDSEFARIRTAVQRYTNPELVKISDRPNAKVGEIAQDIKEFDPKVVIIDHLQRINPETAETAYGYKFVSQALKQMAVEHNVPILLLSQVQLENEWFEASKDGTLRYHLHKISTRWTKEPLGEGDKILFLHNLGRYDKLWNGKVNVIYHSLRDYESGGHTMVFCDFDSQKVHVIRNSKERVSSIPIEKPNPKANRPF